MPAHSFKLISKKTTKGNTSGGPVLDD